jgi:hypothetical protein
LIFVVPGIRDCQNVHIALGGQALAGLTWDRDDIIALGHQPSEGELPNRAAFGRCDAAQGFDQLEVFREVLQSVHSHGSAYTVGTICKEIASHLLIESGQDLAEVPFLELVP